MAEHEQELLLRGATIVPEVRTEKPWTAQRLAQHQEEYGNLRLTKSFLENQLVGVNDRMVELRSLILNGLLDQSTTKAVALGLGPDGEPKSKLSRDPGKMGYGRTESPMDAAPKPKLLQRVVNSLASFL